MSEARLTLVLMAGLPGTGKTRLAYELQSALDWTVLDKDILKARIFNYQQAKISEKESGALAYELIYVLAEDLLVNQKRSVILDSSAVFPDIIENTRPIIEKANAVFKIILCQTDNQTRLQRIQERNKKENGRRQLEVKEEAEDDIGKFDHLRPYHPLFLDTTPPLEEYRNKAYHHLSGEICDRDTTYNELALFSSSNGWRSRP